MPASDVLGPLTHQAYSVACSRIALATRQVARPFVQVRRRGVMLCGQVISLAEFAESGEWFKVDVQIVGPVWVESRNVRLCSGDGRCRCEPDRPCAGEPRAQREGARAGVGFLQAGVVAPPERLTGETRPVAGAAA